MSAGEAPASYAELAEVLEHLPVIVRHTRRQRGLSLRAAARQIGTAPSTVKRIEDGEDMRLSVFLAVLRWISGTGAQIGFDVVDARTPDTTP